MWPDGGDRGKVMSSPKSSIILLGTHTGTAKSVFMTEGSGDTLSWKLKCWSGWKVTKINMFLLVGAWKKIWTNQVVIMSQSINHRRRLCDRFCSLAEMMNKSSNVHMAFDIKKKEEAVFNELVWLQFKAVMRVLTRQLFWLHRPKLSDPCFHVCRSLEVESGRERGWGWRQRSKQ